MNFTASSTAKQRFHGLNFWAVASSPIPVWRQYATAIVALAIAVGVRAAMGLAFPDRSPTYLIFLAPVIAVAFLAGTVPALFVTGVGLFLLEWLFTDPEASLEFDSNTWVIAAVFFIEGAAISLVGGRLRRTVAALVSREQALAASEARLLAAQHAARIATYEWDPVTGTAVWSENAEAVMARPPGSFLGTYEDSFRTVVPEDQPLLAEGAERLMRDGENEVEFRVLDEAGGIHWIRGTGTVTRSDAGEPGRVVGVIIDITERKRDSENNQFLADATADFARSLDYHANVADVARIAVQNFCDLAAVVLVNNGVFPGEVVAHAHRDPDRLELVADIEEALSQSPEAPGVLAQAIRSGQPLFLPSITASQLREAAVSERHLQALQAMEVSSLICIPLVARERTLGALIFGQESGRMFDQADFRIAVELGRRAALAIENSLLLEQSFEREGEVSRANEALQMVADAGVALGSTFDLSPSLNALAKLVVPRFADVCSISLQEEGRLRPVALAAANEELKQSLEAFSAGNRPSSQLVKSAAEVIQSDRPIFLREIPPDLLAQLSSNSENLELAKRVEPRSLILMPLSARGQTLGVMTFMRVGTSATFERDDLSLAGQIARRTAIATDNARLYNDARRANDAKDEFLGMMSHELRTPITVIHGGARVLRGRSENLEPETRESILGDIERESDRLARMLENLLALARAELDREVILEPVLLQRLLPRLIESIGAGSDRSLTFTSEPGVPAVAAEPGYIEHIVRNLVGNAIKYSPTDSPIEIVVSHHNGGAAIRVLDRGFGVTDEEATKIFERFYRSDRTSRLAGGAGLGLAVCKRLVETMSGEIWATPREDGGLEVGFSVPAYKEEHAE